ncbi:MAG TPA: response regulator [Polyangiales bacterium]|nr:response regulator [Polyangiales bacterium]
MKTILIVDDSATVRQQVGLALNQSGYGVIEADDGRAGLLMLARSGISMVICDINMPRMTGLEMLESLRRNPRHAAIPVLMLTSERHPALVERARNAGANGWITKPFNAEALISAVAKLVGA